MTPLILSVLIVVTPNAQSQSLEQIRQHFDHQPFRFHVDTVTVGSNNLPTLWVWAVGKWSDAGPNVEIQSTEIHCYQRFGFCEVASAYNEWAKGWDHPRRIKKFEAR